MACGVEVLKVIGPYVFESEYDEADTGSWFG